MDSHSDERTYCNRMGCGCGLPRDESKPITRPLSEVFQGPATAEQVREAERLHGIGCWPPVEDPRYGVTGLNEAAPTTVSLVRDAMTQGVAFPRLEDIINEAELLRKRYEERLQRQTANMTALVAKYNAVIAVAEELIEDYPIEEGSYYVKKLEAAKRTGDDG